jgi:hypothetical protein
VREVLHARFTEYACPMHSHDAWTLLVIDAGAVRYELDRHEHGALTSLVTLLPHDGRTTAARPARAGFRKRVVYLEREVLGDGESARTCRRTTANPSDGDDVSRLASAS